MEDIKKYLTVRQVANQLGLSEEWIRDLIAKKELKAVKIRQWKIRPTDLNDFVKGRWNTTKTL
ncbi:MAG: helix-turn-helix domain-containing protein [bacterium]